SRAASSSSAPISRMMWRGGAGPPRAPARAKTTPPPPPPAAPHRKKSSPGPPPAGAGPPGGAAAPPPPRPPGPAPPAARAAPPPPGQEGAGRRHAAGRPGHAAHDPADGRARARLLRVRRRDPSRGPVGSAGRQQIEAIVGEAGDPELGHRRLGGGARAEQSSRRRHASVLQRTPEQNAYRQVDEQISGRSSGYRWLPATLGPRGLAAHEGSSWRAQVPAGAGVARASAGGKPRGGIRPPPMLVRRCPGGRWPR